MKGDFVDWVAPWQPIDWRVFVAVCVVAAVAFAIVRRG